MIHFRFIICEENASQGNLEHHFPLWGELENLSRALLLDVKQAKLVKKPSVGVGV